MIHSPLINNIALMLALSTLFFFVLRFLKPETLRSQIINGLIFGGVAIVGMINGFSYAPGVVIDGRAMVVSLSGLFGGPLTAIITAALAAGYRFYLGGVGTLAGILLIVTSAVAGIVFHQLWRKKQKPINPAFLYGFGLLVHILMVLCMFALPGDHALQVIAKTAVPGLLYFPVGSMLLGSMLLFMESQTSLETQLRESEERFTLFLKNFPGSAFMKDENRRFIFLNERFAEEFKINKKDWIGKTSDSLWPEDLARKVKQYDLGVLESGRPLQTFDELPLPGGKRTYVTSKFPIFRANKPPLIGALAVDITDQLNAEQLIRNSEQRYQMLFEQSNDGIVIHQAGKILEVNPKVCSLLGSTKDRLLTMSIFDLSPPERRSQLRQWIDSVADGQPVVFETEHTRRDGTIVYLEISCSLIDYEQRIIQDILRDVTNRKKSEIERNKLQAKLRQAQKMEAIGTLAGGIAHDFNNILSSVIGFAELCLDDVEQGTLFYDNVNEIYSAGIRAKDLVQQILAFSRQSEHEKKPLQLQHVIHEALKLIQATMPANIEIRKTIQSGATILADAVQIHQLIMNLSANAGHAMREKGGVLDIRLTDINLDDSEAGYSAEISAGTYVAMTISDTGYGISSDIIERIFDPFFTTKKQSEGTGLGLSVVHGIVKSHDGVIQVSSTPGNGTTFKILLPTIDDVEAERTLHDLALPGGSERILLVDDEPAIAKMSRQMLTSLGYQVETFTDIREALTRVENSVGEFDLIITDMTMPGMSGVEFARQILAINPSMPIVLATGYSALVDERKALSMGIKGFITKPILKRDIAVLIRKTLDDTVPTVALKRSKILIVDDDRSVSKVLMRTLNKKGYRVLTAVNGRRGLQMIRDNRPDLVITDMIMPEMDGIELLHDLKQTAPHTPVIAMSGGGQVSSDYYLDLAKQWGAVEVFAKPLDLNKLTDAIRAALS